MLKVIISGMKSALPPTTTSEITTRPYLEGDRAVVQCEKFRCLAVSDGKGKWIDFYTRQELKDVNGIILRLDRKVA